MYRLVAITGTLLIGCGSLGNAPDTDRGTPAPPEAKNNVSIVTRILAPDEEQEESYRIQIEFWKQQRIQKTHILTMKQSWCELASIEAKALRQASDLYVVTFICEKGVDNFFRNISTLLISVGGTYPRILHQDEGLFESSPFCISYDLPTYASLDAHTVAVTRESKTELGRDNCLRCTNDCGSDQNCLSQCNKRSQECINSQECLLMPIPLHRAELISY